jgi:hypothetical protein
MSVLWAGDEELHCTDSSHRWIAPDPVADAATWTRWLRAHVDEYRIGIDGPPARRRVTDGQDRSWPDR